MIREPIIAGRFYAAKAGELDKQIQQCFFSKNGPGKLPAKRDKDRRIFGVIAPHAGYIYSGACAAWAYKEIAESAFPEMFIILGTSHSGLGGTAASMDDWKTPLGAVKPHRKFMEQLLKYPNFISDRLAHVQEHSIEAQLPFLQFACRDKKSSLRIVPVNIAPDGLYEDVAKDLVRAILSFGKRVVIIASSDFTHYGLSYGFMPFKHEVKEHMYNLDRKAIHFINNLDAAGFLKYVEESGATICGAMPIAVLLEVSRLMKVKSAELLHYYTSGDVTGDYTNSVGYASLVVR